ncbi:MAG: AAA family ATPase [Defluviitaleaceae bacterium]|nr:AAA family ATPase [Defluviitaleaceae bacterium]
MNIRLSQVRIENFRSIEKTDINLGQFSVLFGMNDSGKSNFIRALALALGSKGITERDVFCSNDSPYTTDTNVIIDLKFVPIGDESFDNSSWGLHLGDNVQTDDNDNEYFAFRTKFSYDADKGDYKKEKLLITSWKDGVTDKHMGNKTLASFELVYLDAHRDMSLDIRDKTSIWSRRVSKLKMSETAKKDIENSLVELGDKIMNESPFLQQAAEDLTVSTNTNNSNIDIHPITRTVDEIYRGLDIYVTQGDSSAISISNMGSGTRSRAVFASLKTVINDKMKNANDTPFFCLVAFEEPEAHIHPQAQRKLIDDFLKIYGQKIITTHSPYILSASSIEDLIYMELSEAKTRFAPLINLNLKSDEQFKVKRMIIDTRGEILFAKIIVLAEGETERLALPIFFKNYFGYTPYELGVNITNVDGHKNFLTFLRIFENINVPWFLFGDGESAVEQSLIKAIKKLKKLKGDPDLNQYDNIILLGNNLNFESYLVNQGYCDEIISAINTFEGLPRPGKKPKFERFASDKYSDPNSEKCKICECNIWVSTKNDFCCDEGKIWVSTKNDFCCDEGKKAALIACMSMSQNKVKYAIPIAEKILECDDERKYPPKIKLLLEEVEKELEVRNGFIRQTEASG